VVTETEQEYKQQKMRISKPLGQTHTIRQILITEHTRTKVNYMTEKINQLPTERDE
jgi:predicted secreted protein